MRKAVLVLLSLYTSSGVFGSAIASTITPYPTPGLPNSQTYTFTALSTGDITGFFAGASAADTSKIGVSVNGASPTVFGLSNQTSAVSQSLDFGSVFAGDILTFQLQNLSTGIQLSSDRGKNSDGLQYAFAANFYNLGGAIPNGLQVSFEDRLRSQSSDLDYNDASFVFTNVAAADPAGAGAAPLPAALSLFMAGAGVIAFTARWGKRRRRRHSRRIAVPITG